ncbi:unnamed protein product [Linum tenue]|uniref:LysM domain-containing protein n=1 Tax=Linum tenue TaxID=586396 RepID=A0AAV0RWZ0_9ROSI|nr:unnamed protein product [Linum tenue]CAI0619593.1 unnamed protein product [Linum tenue]CAI0620400.1 unnamed protein product [Linum tenue]
MLALLVCLLITSSAATKTKCSTDLYVVEDGEDCYKIATAHNMSVEELESLNPYVSCAKLQPGNKLCLGKNY